jgi:hypothetical protein
MISVTCSKLTLLLVLATLLTACDSAFLSVPSSSVSSPSYRTTFVNSKRYAMLTTTSTATTAALRTDFPVVATSMQTAAPVLYSQQQQQAPLTSGIRSYLEGTNPITMDAGSSSSLTVALQERKIPTKEEIDQKKLTFNVIFWGGGFVAPFIATVFYFGFRFWEK